MARTAIPITSITLAGITPSATDGAPGDVANGNVITGNNGRTMFIAVANTGAVPYTCNFVTPGTVGAAAHAIADKLETLAAGAKFWYGPFPTEVYGNDIWIDVNNVAVKLQAFQINP